MDFSPTMVFRLLLALLCVPAAYFTVDVEWRKARVRGSAVDLELSSGDSVTLLSAIDGDEVSVRRGGRTFTVRLLGIKAFEALNEPGLGGLGQRATDALDRHRDRGDLTLRFTEQASDPSGRILAYLHGGETDLGRALVGDGVVLVYTKYPFDRSAEYLATEGEARAQRRGIWAHPKAAQRASAVRTSWEASP